MRIRWIAVSPFLFAAACGGDQPASESAANAQSSQPASSATPPAPPPATASAVASSAPAAPAAPTPAWTATGFQTPESVLYDAEGDRFLVSNINGKPLDKDNNGYISELSPDGKVTKEKVIAGGENKVTLNAPKGMAVAGGVLYVADIDTVRMFDAKTNAPKGEVKIAGATFLNDVAASPDGKVYITDSGMKQGAKGFDPTGTDAVWVIEKGKAKALAKTKDLGQPNGVVVTEKGVFINTFGSNEVFRLDDKGAKQDVTKTPKGGLDGLFIDGDTIWTSSWEGSAVYKGKIGGTMEQVFGDLKSPADFGIDTKRKRIVIPQFLENKVVAFDIK
jgi:sugar lactone lactonase YvrE